MPIPKNQAHLADPSSLGDARNDRPLYIFDLDGTLALIHHRRHFVEKPSLNLFDEATRRNDLGAKWKPRWKEFHAACVDDKPNTPVITILEALTEGPENPYLEAAEIWIFSGRSDEVRKETEDWLAKHVIPVGRLVMRTKGDFTPDDVLKRLWYEEMSDEDKARLVAVFDDRDRIVKMWRELGITCLQVAPGDF